MVGFTQCEPATPAIIDIFSRPCNKTLDCLPNYCCQEGSKKVCRPPKQTILNFAVTATSVSIIITFTKQTIVNTV